ncbi:hypothetical protein G9A89_011552 [Geosiphon pyriformis]|nr:hypothetical protein G9A89_011552 [Geosiphon pyriformis]
MSHQNFKWDSASTNDPKFEDSYSNSPGFKIESRKLIAAFQVAMGQVQLFVTFLVLFSIWRIWIRTGKQSPSMAIRFPLYIAFTVCKNKNINLGKFDYKLVALDIGTTLIIALISIPSYGADTYRCSTTRQSSQLLLVGLIFNLLSWIFAIFCSVKTIQKVGKLQSEQSTQIELDNLTERVIAKKIASYILIFSIKWISTIVHLAGKTLDGDAAWVYIVTGLGTSLGSVGNAIQFYVNEGSQMKFQTKKMINLLSSDKNPLANQDIQPSETGSKSMEELQNRSNNPKKWDGLQLQIV